MLNFSEETIHELISFALNFPGKRTYHITRLALYKALTNRFSDFDAPGKKCLSVSGSEKLAQVLGLKSTEVIDQQYPKFNFLNIDFKDNTFDFCISDQVMEHVDGSPFRAFAESARVIRPGGYICHTSCFIFPVHKAPKDLWRYTPDAFELMAKESGLIVETADSWGNREASELMGSKFHFARIPNDPNNPMHKLATRNEPDWPIVTWIVARKPEL